MSKLYKISRAECSERFRIQTVRPSMLMNNLISFCGIYALTKDIFVPKLAEVCFIAHVFHRWRNRFLSAKQTILNAKARYMSAKILICSSLGRVLSNVMSNENDGAKTSLLHDQKRRCINFHYLRVFW